MYSLPVFFDITKAADFRQKNADVSRTEGVCDVSYMFFRFSLGRL